MIRMLTFMREYDMGFVKDAANVATFGLIGSQLNKKKKRPEDMQPRPTMISNRPFERPMSLIGSRREGY